MKASTPGVVSMPSFDTVKMEDRKRPAVDDVSRTAQPVKRQAVTVNGGGSHPDADMPWKDDIEDFTKDAIQRRMREYKREAQTTRDQLADLTKRAAYHDKHLRTVDSWFAQLLDDVAIACGEVAPSEQPDGFKPLDSSLLNAPTEEFDAYVKQKAEEVLSAIKSIFSRLPSAGADSSDLQARVSRLLENEKKHTSELARINQEKEQLSDRLENASIRYMMAEKKMDRFKSQAVQKLEASAKAPPSRAENENETSTPSAEVKVVDGASSQDLQNADLAKKQAIAAREKIAEQLTRMEEANQKLTEQLTAAQSKQSGLTDEDYAATELYKTLRAQHEDVIKRVNDLQTTHIQLRNEIKQMQSERTAYKDEADKEAQEANIEVERQVGQLEVDLARVRKGRDEAVAELNVRKANDELDKDTLKQKEQLHAAQESRLEVLESEVQRLRSDRQAEESAEDFSNLDTEALREKLKTLSNLKTTLEKELTSMGVAWQKAQQAATKKWGVLVDVEERIGKANAEKSKADQKYFGAMKAKEVQQGELRSLKMQTAKTSEIVAQLKETESSCRSTISHLEKQLAEARDTNASLTQGHRDLQQKSFEQRKKADQLAAQTMELEKALKQKDSDGSSTLRARHKAEQDLQELQERYNASQRSLESSRQRGNGSEGTEFEVLKSIATCSVCRTDFKTTVIKTCGHVFCEKCIQNRITNRARKCPNCGKAFGANDTMKIVL